MMSAVTSYAGAAVVDITPPVGGRMGGYGRRTDPSAGVMHPLTGRAIVLSDGHREIAMVVCDLLGVGSDLVALARTTITDLTGIPGDHVMIAAIHTHGGPASIRAADDAEFAATTARALAAAVLTARQDLAAVTLKFGTVEVGTISQNRRDPDGPHAPVARVLVFDTPQPGAPVATIVNFACHATVLEWDNQLISPDFPGAMVRFVERELGGVALYLQGACGDVNPVWMRHDEAEVDRVGGILGAAATRLAHEMRPLDTGQWCFNLSWSEQIEAHGPGAVMAPLDLAAATAILELPRRVRAAPDEIDRDLAHLEHAMTHTEELADLRHMRAHINRLETERLFAVAPPGKPTQRVEVQVLRLSSDAAVVALPGEFFVSTGEALVRDAGLPALLVAGYANGFVGYVPPPADFAEGGYEVGMTQFDETAEPAIVAAAVASLRALYL